MHRVTDCRGSPVWCGVQGKSGSGLLMSIGYDDLYKTFEDVLAVHTFKLS